MPQTRRDFIARSGALLAAPPPVPETSAPSPRKLLATKYPPEKLASVLGPIRTATARQRSAWEAIPSADRAALVAAGERALTGEWGPLPATLFLEYARTGNRSNFERRQNARRARLRELVVAECVEARGRFLDEIVNGVWTTCEETYWGVPAHLGLQKAGPGLPDAAEPTVDLFSAETGALLAWTVYLLGPALDSVSPLVRPRVRAEAQRRILTPNLERNFSWMGIGEDARERVNNWDPWICSNWLTVTLLLEPDPQRRVAAVSKILRCLDKFLDAYYDDGGCDEGPGYWSRAGASLFDCLELLRSASSGAVDVYDVPLVKEIGRYIYRVHIHDDWYINFADASAKESIPADLVYRYGQRIGDEKLMALGGWASEREGDDGSHRGDSIGRQLPALFNLAALRSAPRSQALVRDAWFPGIQVMAARLKEDSAQGLYLAAQGGHNAESHNHNDVGNFIVYLDGEPFIIDIGVETYTAKTFSPQRYEIWTMQSAWHNCPTIGGVMQKDGRQYEARDVRYRSDGGAAELRMNIAKAYPPEAGLSSWQRTLRLDRAKNEVRIADEYVLSNTVPDITLTLMTPRPVEKRAGELLLDGKLRVLFDAQLAPAVEEVEVRDSRLKHVWGDTLYRILLRADRPALKGASTLRFVPA